MKVDYATTYTPTEVAIYLDDIRLPAPVPYFTWVVVRSFAEFVTYVEANGLPRFISFDHDLGPELLNPQDYLPPLSDGPVYTFYPHWAKDPTPRELTGYHCAHWLSDYCLDRGLAMPHFTVHSANPTGALNILHLLNNLRRHQGLDPTGELFVWYHH